MDVVGFDGELVFDSSKPDGAMRKALNVDQLSGQGWKASVPLKAGITRTYCSTNWLV
jgi:GDP-L-fucose synthase